MAIDSLQYVAFIATSAVLVRYCPSGLRIRLVAALSASCFALTEPLAFVPVLLGTITSTTAQKLIRSSPDVRLTRNTIIEWALVGVTISWMAVAATTAILNPVRADGLPAIAFVLPGSQFIGLQTIAYVVDCARSARRGQHVARHKSIDLFAAISYFPHVFAGPVVRSNVLIQRLRGIQDGPFNPNYPHACTLVLHGLVKKRVLADQMAGIPTLNLNVAQMGFATLLIWGCLRLLQAYFNISGYIDIARGASLAMGITLPKNFLAPLTASQSFRDFWRRWQVTIMAWFRDYVYRPLRGTRRTVASRNVALLLAFVVAGIWHGPAFVIWGFLMALVQIVERPILAKIPTPRSAYGSAAHTITFVWLPWILASTGFRLAVDNSWRQIPMMLGHGPFEGSTINVLVGLGIAVAALIVSDKISASSTPSRPSVAVGLGWASAIVLLLVFAAPDRAVFGYAGR